MPQRARVPADMVAGLDAALRASKQVGAIIRDAMVAGLQAEDA